MKSLKHIIDRIYSSTNKSSDSVYIAKNITQRPDKQNAVQIKWSNYQFNPTLIQTLEQKSLINQHPELIFDENQAEFHLDQFQDQQYRKILVFYQGNYYVIAFESRPANFYSIKKTINQHFLTILDHVNIRQYSDIFPLKMQQPQLNITVSLINRNGSQFLPFVNIHTKNRLKGTPVKQEHIKQEYVKVENDWQLSEGNRKDSRTDSMIQLIDLQGQADEMIIPQEQQGENN